MSPKDVKVRRPVKFIIPRIFIWPVAGMNTWLLIYAMSDRGGEAFHIAATTLGIFGFLLAARCELRTSVRFSGESIHITNSFSRFEINPEMVEGVEIRGTNSGLLSMLTPGVCFRMKNGKRIDMQVSLGIGPVERGVISSELTRWGKRYRVPVSVPTLGSKKSWSRD
jgi:hypothetical protein